MRLYVCVYWKFRNMSFERILLWCNFYFYCWNCCKLHSDLAGLYVIQSVISVLIHWELQRLAMQLLLRVMWAVVTVVVVVHCTAFTLLAVYRLVLLLRCDSFRINICSSISPCMFFIPLWKVLHWIRLLALGFNCSLTYRAVSANFCMSVSLTDLSIYGLTMKVSCVESAVKLQPSNLWKWVCFWSHCVQSAEFC